MQLRTPQPIFVKSTKDKEHQYNNSMQEMINKAIECFNNGDAAKHLSENTTARIANSKKYSTGEVVRFKGKQCAFITSIRWNNANTGTSIGGFLVMNDKGKMVTATAISKI